MTTQDDTKRFYDATAEEVAEKWYPNDTLLPTIREFLSLLPSAGSKVLDLGCGPGHESMRLASAGATVLGLDFSCECIRIARERSPQCRFEVLDFRELDTRFGKFNGVFAAASHIHISPDELPGVMSRVADVLEERGYLLAVVQDGEGFHEHRPVIEGQRLRRIIYRYRKEDLASATQRLSYRRELRLADKLIQQGWRAHLLRMKT